MSKEELEILKLQADKERETAITPYLQNDAEYNYNLKQSTLLEQLYTELELSEHQRCVINTYLQIWSDLYIDYSTYSYLAGVQNALSGKCHINL